MDPKLAANILYKATHDQSVPFEALVHATKWYCDRYHDVSVEHMKTWSESAADKNIVPYRHVDLSG